MTRIAIGAIMKQEAPYILEWVAYHRALGFELIIADNGGTDDTSKILTALDDGKVITRIDFRFLKKAPQVPAYRAIMRLARKMEIDIIGFLDCDEFFSRQVPVITLSQEVGAQYIEREFQKYDASQLSYYWLPYGSKTNHQDISIPVLERFSYHATTEKQERDNKARSYKSFSKVNESFNFLNIFNLGPLIMSPHIVDGAMKKWIVDDKQVAPYASNLKRRRVTHNNGLVMHFMIKSQQEFLIKKGRGSGTDSSQRYIDNFFTRFDFNDIYDPVKDTVISQLLTEINGLKEIVELHRQVEITSDPYTVLRTRLLAIGLTKFEHRRKYVKFRKVLSKQKTFMLNRISKLIRLISRRNKG